MVKLLELKKNLLNKKKDLNNSTDKINLRIESKDKFLLHLSCFYNYKIYGAL